MMRLFKRLLSHRNPLRLLWHKIKVLTAALRYAFPARGLTVIGITGTDGKTTTVGMVAHILHTSGLRVGALSTAFFLIDDELAWNATQKTSPSPFTIQKFLRNCKNSGCTHVVLEYSSHGLVQGRTLFTWPQVAAITNTSPEHLDYHRTMEQYRTDKGILFRMLKGKGTKVLNGKDEAYAQYCALPSAHTIAYGTPDGLYATDIVAEATGTRATVHRGGETAPLHLPIPGTFNIENALCAIGCAMAVTIPLAQATTALSSFPGIPGRMERINEGQNFHVFIDFTVTPASYARTLGTLADTAKHMNVRLLVLMGSCGDRMKEKRPDIGRIASTYADTIVVTNEDPYTEDPEKIIDDVLATIEPAKAHRIVDRAEAIRWIFDEAKPGDIVILCGKGSDTTMWTAKGRVPWNEREIARTILREKRV